MSKFNCNVMRDILPLYADEVVCPDTRELVEEHLEGCEGCRRELDALRETVVLPVQEDGLEVMKKVKRKWGKKQLWKGIAIASVIAAVLMGTFFYLYGYGLPVKAEYVTQVYGLECTPGAVGVGDEVRYDTQSWVIKIGTTCGRVITRSHWEPVLDENGVQTHSEIRIDVRISPFVFPWDQTGPNSHGLVGWPNQDRLDTIFRIVCADQEFTYSMEEQGLWDENAAHSPEFCPNCTR